MRWWKSGHLGSFDCAKHGGSRKGRLTAYCIATHDCMCHQSSKLDLGQLVDRLGLGFSIPANHAQSSARCVGASNDPLRALW